MQKELRLMPAEDEPNVWFWRPQVPYVYWWYAWWRERQERRPAAPGRHSHGHCSLYDFTRGYDKNKLEKKHSESADLRQAGHFLSFWLTPILRL